MAAVFSISGDKQLKRRLMKLHPAVERKVVTKAIRTAARPIVARAKDNILPIRASKRRRRESRALGKPASVSGRLRRSMGFVMRQYRRTGVVLAVIGPRYPLGAHGHLVEFGTAGLRPHPITGTSGIMPAKPFLRPAWDASLAYVRLILHQVVGAGIISEATKG